MAKKAKTASKYKPRTEEQKARRRERDRARREEAKKKTDSAKKFLKAGGTITPKNSDRVLKAKKPKKACTKKDANPKRKLAEDIVIKGVMHKVRRGDVVEFVDFSPVAMFDLGRRVISIAFCSALMQNNKTVTA